MKRCHLDVLVRTVYAVWNTGRLYGVIGKVFHRLERVLTLINDGRRSNDRAEDKCGVKFEGMKFDFNKNMTYTGEVNGVTDEDIRAGVNADDDETEVEFEEETV